VRVARGQAQRQRHRTRGLHALVALRRDAEDKQPPLAVVHRDLVHVVTHDGDHRLELHGRVVVVILVAVH